MPTPIIQHTGSNDPTTEGWHVFPPNVLPTASGIHDTDPQPSPVDAWQVQDLTSSGGFGYVRDLSSSEVSDIKTQGWVLSAKLRAVRQYTPDDGSIVLSLQLDGERWCLWFKEDGSGLTQAYLQDQPFAIPGHPANSTPVPTGALTQAELDAKYLTYKWVGCGKGTADLFINDRLVMSNVSSSSNVASALNRKVGFGSGSTPGVGVGNFANVQFATGPCAPATD